MLKRCGLFLLAALAACRVEAVFCAEYSLLDLEPIIIHKASTQPAGDFSLDAESLENLPFSSPIESLSLLPVDLESRTLSSGIQSDFSLRGSTVQGVLMLINGQRLNDPQTAHHNSDLPLTKEDIERIDLISNVGSTHLGCDAMGGAINFLVKKPDETKRVLELALGRFQTKGGLFSISDKLGPLGMRLSLEDRESRGFHEDTDYKVFTTTLASSLTLPNSEFNASWGYQEKEFGAYDFYTPGSGYPSKEWTKTYLLSTGLNFNKEGLTIRPGFIWRRHYDKFMLDKTQVRSNYLNHHRTDMYTPNIYFQEENGTLGRIGLGLEYGQELINSTNLGRHDRDHKSISLDYGRDLLPQLSSQLSWRGDSFSGQSSIYAGSAGLRYRISKEGLLNFGVSRSGRIPSFTELYYDDPTTVGNSGLSPEESVNYQAGYDYRKADLSWGMTFFLRREKDLIDWIKRTGGQAKWQAENINQADVLGLEGYLEFHVSPHLTSKSNYTYINKRTQDRGYPYKYGSNYIRHLINSGLNFKLPWGTQSITSSYKKRPGRSGWFLVNMHLDYNLRKETEIFLNITNLFNIGYQEIEGIPQPGRYIEGGLRFEW